MKAVATAFLGVILTMLGFAAGAGPFLTAQQEVEPNDTAATATLLGLNGMRGMGAGAVAAGDADYWRIDNLPAGGRIWIYVDTGGTQNAGATSRDSTVTLYAADGTTVIETDDDDGIGNGLDGTIETGLASVIAGRILTAGGTYYVKVAGFGSGVIDPYRLNVVATRANLPVAESENNNDSSLADSLLDASSVVGVRAGTIGVAGDIDWYSIAMRAGDILFLAADGDPLRTGTGTDVVLKFYSLDGATLLLTCNGSQGGSVANPAGEGCGYRTTNSGTYYVSVEHAANLMGAYSVLAANMTRAVVDATAEVEPNDTFGTATRLQLANRRAIGAGAIRAASGDQADLWRIDVSVPVRAVWAYVDTGGKTNPGSQTRDVVLTAYGQTGAPITAGTGNATGNGLDGTIETTQAAAVYLNGSEFNTYYFKVESALSSFAVDPYRLYVTAIEPQVNQAQFEAEPNDTPGTATPMVTLGEPTYQRSGSFSSATDKDWYSAVAGGGDILFAALDSPQNDLVIDLYAPDGVTLLLSCDAPATGSNVVFATGACAYQVGTPGTYYFLVRLAAGAQPNGDYLFMAANMTQYSSPPPPLAAALLSPNVGFGPPPGTTPATAAVLTLNGYRATAESSISGAGDVDYWRIDGALPNSKIWAYVDTGGDFILGSTDSKLFLLAADGSTVIESDDDDGTGNGLDTTIEAALASAIAGRTLTAGGTYYLKVQHYNQTQSVFPYRIYVVVTPPFVSQSEQEENGSRFAADIILQPNGTAAVRTGSIGQPGDVDWFKFTVDAGDIAFLALDGDPARVGAGPDFVLDLIKDGLGVPLLTCDHTRLSTALNSAAEGCAFRFEYPGTYYARVSEASGLATGPYAVMVANFGTRLTLDIDLAATGKPYDALTDGLMTVRHMLLPANTNITEGGVVGPDPQRTPQQMKEHLDLLTSALDVDGDGVVDPATDGILILRYMMGTSLFQIREGALGPNATRTELIEILRYLQSLMP